MLVPHGTKHGGRAPPHPAGSCHRAGRAMLGTISMTESDGLDATGTPDGVVCRVAGDRVGRRERGPVGHLLVAFVALCHALCVCFFQL